MDNMIISAEQLDEIEQFAYKYMLRHEIALITDVPAQLMFDESHPAGIAFLKGRLKRKAEFNGEVIKLSKQLSSPAMAIEKAIAENTNLMDLRR